MFTDKEGEINQQNVPVIIFFIQSCHSCLRRLNHGPVLHIAWENEMNQAWSLPSENVLLVKWGCGGIGGN